MTRDQLVSVIARRVGFRTDLNEAIVEELQLAQNELEQGGHLPNFMRKAVDLAVVATEQSVSLPSDFLRESTYEAVMFGTGNPFELVRRTVAEAQYIVSFSPAGVPLVYSRDGLAEVLLWPIPSESTTLWLTYYAKVPVLASGTDENKWSELYPNLLVGKAGAVLAETLQNLPLAQVFSALADTAWANLVAADAADDASGATLKMGGWGRG